MSASTASNKSFKTKLHHRKLGAVFTDTGKRAPGDRRKPVLVRLAPLPGTTASNKPPVRIFVGTEPAQFRAERVFVWSIKKHRDPARAYEIYLMSDLEGFDRSTWKTGFTQYRYARPGTRRISRVARFTTTSTRSISRIRPSSSISICAARRYLSINDKETSVMLLDCAKLAPLWQLASCPRARQAQGIPRARTRGGTVGNDGSRMERA